MGNRYFTWCILLFAAPLFACLAPIKLWKEYQALNTELSTLTSEYNAQLDQVNIRESTLLVRKTAEAPRYEALRMWRPWLSGMDTPPVSEDGSLPTIDPQPIAERAGFEFLRAASDAAQSVSISLQDRRSGVALRQWGRGEQIVSLADVTAVAADYYKLMNWIGMLEASWPTVRIESLDFGAEGVSQGAGFALRMSIQATIPTFLEKAKE